MMAPLICPICPPALTPSKPGTKNWVLRARPSRLAQTKAKSLASSSKECNRTQFFPGPLKPLRRLFAVAVQCIEDNGIRFARGAYLIHLDGLAFEQLVVLEKPSQHNQAVRRHFRGLVVGVKLGILGGDGNDFVVRLAGVDHRHQPDGSPMN